MECNPSIFTGFTEKLGYPCLDLAFYDVMSLDADMWLAMVPSPVAAVIVAFPLKECHQELRQHEIEEQKADHSDVVFIKDRIENGWATIALLHALLNTREYMVNGGFAEDSFLDRFQTANFGASSDDMWQYLQFFFYKFIFCWNNYLNYFYIIFW